MFVPFSRFRECAIKLYGQKHFRENFVKFGEAAYFGHTWAKNKFFSGNNGENTKPSLFRITLVWWWGV